MRRLLDSLLFALFSGLMLIPLVRRWRRRPWWIRARILLAAIGLAGLGYATFTAGSGLAWTIAGAFILAAALLGPLTDPDHERKLQRRHRAEYLLNGGRFLRGALPNSDALASGEELYLLLRGPHLLFVPRHGDGEVHAAIVVGRIERIEVDDEVYLPIYVSEAKDPPVREAVVDQQAVSVLRLTLADGGAEEPEHVELEYPGAFHKHLAETAAHAVHSVRELERRPTADPRLAVIPDAAKLPASKPQ